MKAALQHHQAGRLNAAEHIYRQILAVAPNQPDALHLLGLVAHQSGQQDAAIDYLGRAVAVHPSSAIYHNSLGEAYRAAGRSPQAAACYRRAIELAADYADAHNNLGTVLSQQGMLHEAIACYRRAVELEPAFAEAHNNLGIALKEQGKLDEAVACYRRALAARPEFAQAHANLGNALKEQENPREALASLQRAVALNPDDAEAHNNLGNLWQALGDSPQAIACYQRALELKPGYAEAHNNLANVLQEQGKSHEAIACYQRALTRAPQFAAAHANLGNALRDQGSLDEAIASYRRAIDIEPHFASAHANLGNAFKDQGSLDESIACYRRAVELQPDYAEAHSNLVYVLHFHPDWTAEAICEEHRRWNCQHAEPLAASIEPHHNDRTMDRPLRIGYLSPNFRHHVVGLNLLPLLQAHDRRQFQVVCYSDVTCADAVTEQLRSHADVWRPVVGLPDPQLAAIMRQDAIDILVDLTLHMAHNRLRLFARKPAPVQVTFAGYPGTTGLSAIDYRLTDPWLDPPGENDRHYTEESVRLPHSFWCYAPASEQPPVNALPAAEQGYVTFGCLNNFCKVNLGVLELWSEVLRRVDRSRLLLLAPQGSHRQRTLDFLEQQGIEPARVTFAAPLPHRQYLELYHQIDLGLDTFPYNGHTTSLDSFWMGVPVVTLAGITAVGRGGLSQLTNLGLPELIARTREDFVRIAVDLAADRPRLAQLRAGLRRRMEDSPLMDARRFARDVESAYRTLWRRWCRT
jgi:predicted O-linked N-acetylglucosamine transferase (SPINDLY family)